MNEAGRVDLLIFYGERVISGGEHVVGRYRVYCGF
jgi:hypothetical protein